MNPAPAPQRRLTTFPRWVCAVVCLAAAAAMAGASSLSAPVAAHAEELHAVFEGCSQEMLRNTCAVAGDRSPNIETTQAQVFIAGVGLVDAAAYKGLRDAGNAMCSQVRRSCTLDWSGSACKTARSLWAQR